MTVAAALVPIFFAMAVGYGAGMTGLVDNRHVDALNTVVMVIALPIALFTILASSDRADIVEHSAVGGAGCSSWASPTWASTSPNVMATCRSAVVGHPGPDRRLPEHRRGGTADRGLRARTILGPLVLMAFVGTFTYEFEVSLPVFAERSLNGGVDG